MYQRWFQSLRVDGLVLNRIRSQDWRISYLSEKRVPFVTLGRLPSNQDYPYILVNERGGFERLVMHLVQKGHKRLAYVGASPNLMIQIERFAGYKRGLELSGISYDGKLVRRGNLTEEGGYSAAQKLLAIPDPPTAILGCNDLTAIGILKAAQESGLQVGKDLAVAGYDGIQETAYTTPPLTTLRQPTYEIARRLTVMLILLTNGNMLDEPHVVFEPDLILRDSTE